MEDLVRRHDVLRVRFDATAGDPVAVLDDAPQGSVELVDCGADDDAETTTRAQALVEQPFDLATDQPWRAWLLRRSPTDHLLLLVLHHVAADGWSVRVVLDHLAAAYRDAGATVLPDAAPVQYADWAAHRASAGDRKERLAHWLEHLAGAPGVLALPTDRARPAVADPAARTVRHRLSDEAERSVGVVCSATRTTPFMVLTGALHLVLSRLTAADDIVIGTAVAGRTHRDTEGLVGCFVNTVALRTRSDDATTVRDLMAQVRDTTVDGLGHQDVAFEDVVDAVSPVRDVSTTPVFQTMLTVHTEPEPRLDLGPDVAATWLDLTPQTAKTDLSLHVSGSVVRGAGSSPAATDDADGTQVEAVHRSALFDEGTVRRWMGMLDRCLVALAHDLDAPLGSLDLLTGEDRTVTASAQGSSPRPVTASSVHALLDDAAARHPDAPAVVSRGETLTHRGLQAASNRLARRLQELGVRPDARVGLLLERSCELVVGIVGALRSGGAYVPVDPLYPDARIASVLSAAQVDVVVTDSRHAHRVSGPLVVLDDPADPVATTDDGPLADRTVPGDLAYVLFTSGSTGTPKGVAVEHGHLLTYLAQVLPDLDVEQGWAWAQLSSPSADLGLTNLFGALTTGGVVHVLTYEQVTDPAAMRTYLSEHRVDAVKMTPSHLAALADDDLAAVLPHRVLVLAGEACPWELVDAARTARPGLTVHNHYGPTETTVSVLGTPVAALPKTSRNRGPVVPLGRPFRGTRAHVVDASGRPVPLGVPGELVIAGPTVARGYLGRDDLTAARFGTEDPSWPGAHPEHRRPHVPDRGPGAPHRGRGPRVPRARGRPGQDPRVPRRAGRGRPRRRRAPRGARRRRGGPRGRAGPATPRRVPGPGGGGR